MSDQKNVATVVSQGQYDALRQYAEANNLKVSGVLRRMVAEFTGVPSDIDGMPFYRRPPRPRWRSKLTPEERRKIKADTCRRLSEIKETCTRCGRVITKGRMKLHLAACTGPKPPKKVWTPEMRSERSRRASATRRAREESLPPEERAALDERRSAKAKMMRSRLTSEQLSAGGAAAVAKISREDRSRGATTTNSISVTCPNPGCGMTTNPPNLARHLKVCPHRFACEEVAR
jgi:predicted  nucleic acid-binding Zn-ribbon protein